ncbi:Flap endonuclease Xni [bioreactor metagenome]|uniref:Flap endonuclease Xni n=2 Tax=root TaxID=1 RepID=A0A644Z4R7_9ZZZZ
MYTAERIYKKWGVLPSQIVEYKAIVGDKSDNINGIKGIGPKTAQKILSLGNINTVIEKDLLDDKLSNMLKEKLDLINRNIKLITMKKDIPIVNESFALRDKIKLNKKPMEIIKESGVY